MVIIFPMLVSQAVSENSIPAIAKTVEIYLVGNATDKIVNHPEVEKLNLNYKIKNGRIVAEQGGPPGSAGGTKRKTQPQPPEPEKKEEDEDTPKKARPKVTVSDYKSISLEPTTVTVDIKRGKHAESRRQIGIKVLPLRVKSEAKLSHLILHDYQLNSLQAQLVSIGRTVLRLIWRFVDVWARRLRIGELTPTGDPRKDVLMGRSGHRGTAFVVLNKSEDIDEYFLTNYKKLRRLSKMGWGNFIIADDINRQAYFCMEEFRGICNVISYEMMYNNLGQLKVYETLEDAKKKSSSLFKIKRRFSRVIGESLAEYKLSKYLSLIREDYIMDLINEYISNLYITENIQLLEVDTEKVMKKMMPKTRAVSIIKKLEDSAREKDARGILSIAKKLGVTKVKQQTVDNIGSSSVDNYNEKKDIAEKVLKNSLRANPKVIEAAASAIAFASMIKKRNDTMDDNRRLKLILRDVVEKGRSFYDSYDSDSEEKEKRPKEISSDYVVAWATITITTAVMASVATFVYLFWPFVLGIFLSFVIIMAYLITRGIVKKG